MPTSDQMKWDLSDLYQAPDDPAITGDLASIDRLITDLRQCRGKIATLPAIELHELIISWEKAQAINYRLDLYSSLLESTNIGIAEVTRFQKSIQEKLVERGTQLIFIETELAQLAEEKWQSILRAPELADYRTFLMQLHEQAKHTLTEAEEKILAEKSQTSVGALSHLFSVTTDTLQFDWDSQTLTLEELLAKFHDADPRVRQQAATTLHLGLKSNDKTTAPILNSLVHDKAISDRLRGFNAPESARFMGDQVDQETVEAMIATATKNRAFVQRYYKLKKRILGVEKLYWWDRYAPLPEAQVTITLDEAKTMVRDGYNQFSPILAELTDSIIAAQHVDWLPSPTKRGGAFCAAGPPGNIPYVLMNYTDKPRDIMTLAHEFGHGLHDLLAGEKNVFLQTFPSLALAEIASVFGETLLFERLINSDISKSDKTALLMSFIEDRFATVFRQSTMFQFEQALHSKRRTEGELSKEEIDELWDTIMKQPFEGALIYTPEHRNSWMYVSHIFEMPFYVYSYAFAQGCVLALYQAYKQEGTGFVEKYLTILRAGGSLSPRENLSQAGFDISKPEFWQGSHDVLSGFIDQLESTIR